MMRWVLAYAACVVLANLGTAWFGIVPLGFGLQASAGVVGAGLTFTVRDLLQEAVGARAAIVAVILGALVSAGFSPTLGMASGVSFLLSELLDLMVYTPLRQRQWVLAVVASNVVGVTVDTFLFLWLAFGRTDLWPGQMVGKLAMTALALPVMWWVKRREDNQADYISRFRWGSESPEDLG